MCLSLVRAIWWWDANSRSKHVFFLSLEDFYHSVLGDREKTRKTFRNLMNYYLISWCNAWPKNAWTWTYFCNVSQATQVNSLSSTKIKPFLSTLHLDAKGGRCRQCTFRPCCSARWSLSKYYQFHTISICREYSYGNPVCFCLLEVQVYKLLVCHTRSPTMSVAESHNHLSSKLLQSHRMSH